MDLSSLSQTTDSRNIEIKATLENVEEKLKIVKGLSDTNEEIINQRDVFYKVKEGRLKLRRFEGKVEEPIAELIFYMRPDENGAKLCKYKKMDVESKIFDSLNEILAASLGVEGTVVKKRSLYIIGQTRVHIDEVCGLGSFIELETVLEATQSIEEGHKILNDIMVKLQIDKSNCLQNSYNDMLINNQRTKKSPEEKSKIYKSSVSVEISSNEETCKQII